jgi:predicted O-methyltransferase YrrM
VVKKGQLENNMIDRTKWSVSKQANSYIEETFIPVNGDLDFAIKNSKKNNLPPIQINPIIGRMLYLTAKMKNAKKILEVGTLGAYSAIWLAKALPSDGELITIDHNKSYAAVAQENIDHAELQDKVTIKIGEALEVLPEIEGQFDLFFIDAHKEEYVQYVEHAIRLSHPGSVIICDNVLRNGWVTKEIFEKEYYKKLHEFNQWLAKHPQLESTILPTVLPLKDRDYVDGMSISVIR